MNEKSFYQNLAESIPRLCHTTGNDLTVVECGYGLLGKDLRIIFLPKVRRVDVYDMACYELSISITDELTKESVEATVLLEKSYNDYMTFYQLKPIITTIYEDRDLSVKEYACTLSELRGR